MKKLLAVCLAAVLAIAATMPVPASADGGSLAGGVVAAQATKATKAKARTALKKKLKSLYSEYKNYVSSNSNGFTGMKYRFVDLNNDGVTELLVSQDGHWKPMNEIYGHDGSKVVLLSSASSGIGGGYFDHRITSYKKKGVFKVHDWHNSYSGERYYKWNGRKAKLLASMSTNWVSAQGNSSYYVNSKKVSKSKYTDYAKKLVKGLKAIDYSKASGWKTYN